MDAHTDNWTDVSDRREDYVAAIDIPTIEDLENISPNDSVKISNGFERFFVRVKTVEGSTIHGMIENHLIGKYDYDYHDIVVFEKKHVFTIRKHERTSKKKNQNTRRMFRLLGINPQKDCEEAMAILSILG